MQTRKDDLAGAELFAGRTSRARSPSEMLILVSWKIVPVITENRLRLFHLVEPH
jgi:hypothetical protein